ncbi:heavy-metal-associated domain-containing protein [Gracilibacillus salinarum]|uniref:Cation transporter n=1 Tax=Gracilibacillus salinarum TaxID=2932255 RepID=A0ABY4GH16_9BACI|nr:heavy metal-associated domain-containing protein [Gracilibacillus salinarum]UOQ83499.1 cation transporter [Gracilibacillus salinarum]
MNTRKLSIPNLKKEDEAKISEALHDVWGVQSVDINVHTQEAIVSYNENAGALHDFQQAIKDVGYDAHVPKGD